jgi:aryl sulfotransferase
MQLMDRIVSKVSSDVDSLIWQDVGVRQTYEILCDIQDGTYRKLNARLSAAGFSDISREGLLVLGAMRRGEAAASALLQRLGITRQAASQSVETLAVHRYLELQDNPNDPGQRRAVFTDRGRAALAEAEMGLVADWWAEFPRRSGDIIISTAPKSGTTWMQMICALLIFQAPSLPAPLQELSPELAALAPRAEFYAKLAAQRHRRFIKTHLPLSELLNDPRATYIVVARNPLDAAVSWHYQIAELFTSPERRSGEERSDEMARQWVLDRIEEMGTFPQGRDSGLDGVLKNLSSAWERRADPNVVLVHYEDLSADLSGEMRRLARRLDITVPEEKWPSLVHAATFKQMRAAAGRLQPLQYLPNWDSSKEHSKFFRRGASGDGQALLTEAEVARYYTRAAQVAPRELLTWLHRDDERSLPA